MQRKIWLWVLVAVLLLGSGPAAYADVYTIIVGPGVGTKITTTPYTISAPGFYYLGNDLSATNTGILIKSNDVTLDLMGFTLRAAVPIVGTGIQVENGVVHNNIEVRNGTVRDFDYGITSGNHQTSNIRIINVKVMSNYNMGISLMGPNAIIRGCAAHDNRVGISLYGIGGVMISGCLAANNREIGFYLTGEGGSIIDNVAINNGESGFKLAGDPYILLDRNSASGNGTNFSAAGSNAVWGLNLGR